MSTDLSQSVTDTYTQAQHSIILHTPEPELDVFVRMRRGEGFGCAVVRADVSLPLSAA